MIKEILKWLGVLVSIVLCIGFYIGYEMLNVLNGYAAKRACTCYYEQGKSLEAIKGRELDFSPIDLADISVDKSAKTLTARTYQLRERTAAYRPGQGCVLINGKDDYNFQYKIDKDALEPFDFLKMKNKSAYTNVKLAEAKSYAFTDYLKTDAILVIHRDSILLESYTDGIDKDTPLLGWSMTKSIMNALVGILIKNNQLSLDQDHLFEEWEADDRSTITLKHLLNMTSGLDWEEDYTKISDATEMLYMKDDIVKHCISPELKYPPGTHWYYSSGTSNIIAGLIKNQFSTQQDYIRFPYDSLFLKLGMASAFVETDESGNFIGSSYGYASARDWAKFGRLYLQDGNWQGSQLLPEGWINHTVEPAKEDVCWYGSQFWLNIDQCNYKELPADLFVCNGFEGQRLMLFPSQDLIILRTGSNDAFDEQKFANLIIASLSRTDRRYPTVIPKGD